MTHNWNSYEKEIIMPAMRPVIEFSECLFDSPKFRSQLSKNEANLDEFEGKLEKLLKLNNTMYESGRQFISVQSQFAAGLWELSSYFAAENPSDEAQVSSNVKIRIPDEQHAQHVIFTLYLSSKKKSK